jgi:hypothetical protein
VRKPAGAFSASGLLPGRTMWTNPQYLHSWRDLRRRELLFWFFVLSYVPGMLLIIAVVDVIGRDLPQHIGAYFSAAWLAGFGVASVYHQNFRCPRCHRFFFRRVRLSETGACKCMNCGLARGALCP